MPPVLVVLPRCLGPGGTSPLVAVFAPVLVPVRTILLFRLVFRAILWVIHWPVFARLLCALSSAWLPRLRGGTLGQADAVLRAAVGQVGIADRTDRLCRLAAVVLLRRLLAAVLLLAVVARVPVAFFDRSIVD